MTEFPKSGPAGKHGEARGQTTPRLILSGFVLVVLAGPLAAAAVDIQQGLASTPPFSTLQAAVIALAFVGVIVTAIFGGGR